MDLRGGMHRGHVIAEGHIDQEQYTSSVSDWGTSFLVIYLRPLENQLCANAGLH